MISVTALCFVFSLSVLNVYNVPIPIEILRVVKDDPISIDCLDAYGRKSKMLLVKIENYPNNSTTIENDLRKVRFQSVVDDTLFFSTNNPGFYGCLSRTNSYILKKCFKIQVYEKIHFFDGVVEVEARSSIVIDFAEQITDDILQYRWIINGIDDYDWDADPGLSRLENKLWIDSFGCDRIGSYSFVKGDYVYPYLKIHITIKDFTDQITTTSARVFYRDTLRATLKINYDILVNPQVFKVKAGQRKLIKDSGELTVKGLNHFELTIPAVSYSDGGNYFFTFTCREKTSPFENWMYIDFNVDIYTLYETDNQNVPLRNGENVALKFNLTESSHNGQNVILESIIGATSSNMVVEQNIVWIANVNCGNYGKITGIYSNKSISRRFKLFCPAKFDDLRPENGSESAQNPFIWAKTAFMRKVNIHQPFNMRCSVSHHGILSLKLLKITKTSQNEIMGKVFANEKNIDGNSVRTLTFKYDIPSIMNEHIGTYRCIAEAQSGLILVQDMMDFHILLSAPLNYTLIRGQRFEVDCGIFYLDGSKYKWTMQNKDKEIVELSDSPVMTLVSTFGTPKGPYKCFLHTKSEVEYQVLSIKLFTLTLLPDELGTKTYFIQSGQAILLNFTKFGMGNLKKIFHFLTKNAKPRVIKLGQDNIHTIQSFQCKDLGVYQTSKSPNDERGKSISLNFDVKISLEVDNYRTSRQYNVEGKRMMIKDPDDIEDSLMVSCSIRGSLPSKVNKTLILTRNKEVIKQTEDTIIRMRPRFEEDTEIETWRCALMLYCKNEEIYVTEREDTFYSYTKHDFNNDILMYDEGRNYAVVPTPEYENYHQSMKWIFNYPERFREKFEINGIAFIRYMSDMLDGVCLEEKLSGEKVMLMMKREEWGGVTINVENGVLILAPGENKTLKCTTENRFRFLKRLERKINARDWSPLAYGIEQDINDICNSSENIFQQSELTYEITYFRSDYVGLYRCVYYDISRGFHQEMYEGFEVKLRSETNSENRENWNVKNLTYTFIKTEELWIEPEEERLVQRGKPTFLTCLATGDVRSMKIMGNKGQVVSMNMNKGYDQIFRIIMEIPQVQDQHYGSYTCVAEINADNENVRLEKPFRIISKRV